MKDMFQDVGIGCMAAVGIVIASAIFGLVLFPEVLLWIVPDGNPTEGGGIIRWVVGGAAVLVLGFLFLVAPPLFRNRNRDRSRDEKGDLTSH